MKKKVIVLLLASVLSTNCGLAKPNNTNYNTTKEVQVSGEHDPLMKLLLSGLIVLSLNLLLTKQKVKLWQSTHENKLKKY